jgi:hypothetical protein
LATNIPQTGHFSDVDGGGGAVSTAAKEVAVIMQAKRKAKKEIRFIVRIFFANGALLMVVS